jgi:hypothetical protein
VTPPPCGNNFVYRPWSTFLANATTAVATRLRRPPRPLCKQRLTTIDFPVRTYCMAPISARGGVVVDGRHHDEWGRGERSAKRWRLSRFVRGRGLHRPTQMFRHSQQKVVAVHPRTFNRTHAPGATRAMTRISSAALINDTSSTVLLNKYILGSLLSRWSRAAT